MNLKQERLYIILAFILIFLLIFGTVLVISKLSIKKEQGFVIQEREVVNCTSKDDCNDQNLCTIDLCDNKLCSNTQVTLCYNNDDCCPGKCNPSNDNDCL
jgi:hypothetical protein